MKLFWTWHVEQLLRKSLFCPRVAKAVLRTAATAPVISSEVQRMFQGGGSL